MNAWRIMASVALGWLVLGGTLRAAEDAEDAKAQKIKKLVGQLAGTKPDEVSAAQKRLAEVGLPALAPLRQFLFDAKEKAPREAAEGVLRQIVQKAQTKLEARLAQLKAQKAIIRPITEGAVARVFPAYLIFSVRFPRFPLSVSPPAPLQANNLFIMDKDGQMDHLTDFKGLDNFFRDNSGKGLKDDYIKEVVTAWLLLWQEFYQDGYYQFVIPAKGIKVGFGGGGMKAIGRATVKEEKGNKGYLEVILFYGVTGDLEGVRVERHLLRGERPR